MTPLRGLDLTPHQVVEVMSPNFVVLTPFFSQCNVIETSILIIGRLYRKSASFLSKTRKTKKGAF